VTVNKVNNDALYFKYISQDVFFKSAGTEVVFCGSSLILKATSCLCLYVGKHDMCEDASAQVFPDGKKWQRHLQLNSKSKMRTMSAW